MNIITTMKIGTGGAENEGGIRIGCIKKDFQQVWPTDWVLRYEQEFNRGRYNSTQKGTKLMIASIY